MDNVQQSHTVERQHIRSRLVLIGFLVVAAFFLFSEHRAHFLGILPYLFLLACPLIHFFHHGHHGHKDSGDTSPDTAAPHEPPARSGEKS